MRRPALVLVALVAAIILPLLPAPAGAEELPPPPEHPTIVGGEQSSSGQFPWTAALLRRSAATRKEGFTCGATVLGPSWILTAGHCVLDYYEDYPDSKYGNYVAPSEFSVLTGTISLSQSGGGQRLNVKAIYPHPNYDPYFSKFDFALLRLAAPTSADAVKLVGSSGTEATLDDPGKVQTTIGWGLTNENGTDIPTIQRWVQVAVDSDGTCSSAYPIGRRDEADFPLEYHASSMICAGPWEGGKDSCSGDSGGPLAIQAGDGTWRQTGVVSFGYGCAEPGNPGVYSRVTSASSWIYRTSRFGPFDPDGNAYVRQQYYDFLHRSPTNVELFSWADHLKSNPAADLITELQTSSTWQNNAGTITRLYRAAFLRSPDTDGLGHWVGRRWAGVGPVAIAQNFATSSEFLTRYGSLNNPAFVDQIYQNIFGRLPDSGGKAYWVGKLNTGTSRGQALYELSNSNEYRTKTADIVRVVTLRFGLLRKVPSAEQVANGVPLNLRTLIDTVRTSVGYAQRFAS